MGRAPGSKDVHILYIGRVDPNHQKLLDHLPNDSINIVFTRTQRAGLQIATEVHPQVIVISTADGHSSGDRLCRTLGRRLPSTQRLLIVDRGSRTSAPCEQRLVRPFTGKKLYESLMSMLSSAAPHVVRTGPLELDMISRIVTGPKGQRRLTPKQCRLLMNLMQRPNQVHSRKDLMEQIWDTVYLGDTRTLDVHIRWLREKIELDPKDPKMLLTLRGVGYMLAVADEAELAERPGTAELVVTTTDDVVA